MRYNGVNLGLLSSTLSAFFSFIEIVRNYELTIEAHGKDTK